MSTQQIKTRLEEMYYSGLAKFKDRQADLAESLTDATRTALRMPGCEVRVTCRDEDECTYVQVIVHDALESMGFLNDRATRLGQIELTNGSCILIRKEKKS